MTARGTILPCQADAWRLPAGVHYLNCAYMAPLLRDVERAGRDALRRWRTPWQVGVEAFFEDADRARALFARLIGAPDGEPVAVVPSASYGIAIAARNIPLRRGMNVVIAEGQFPSNVYAWQTRCRATGATLCVVPRPPRGDGWSARLLEGIDARTAVVALGTIDWTDGTCFDLEAIGARARACGAAYILDGTQSVGAMPFDVARVRPDLLVCAGYKWLLGPIGIGLCYVGERFADAAPLEETWLGRHGSEDFAALTAYQEAYAPGARRFDAGGRAQLVLLPMLTAALERVVAWRPSRIQATCAALAAPAREALGALGCDLDAAGDPHASHLFAVRPPRRATMAALRAALARRRVYISLRAGMLRIAPHVYNAPDDVDALIAAFTDVLHRRSARRAAITTRVRGS